MRVAAPPRVPYAELRWVTAAPDLCRTDIHWFIGGSVVDAQWPKITVAAVASVGISRDGDLVAFGQARLPANVCTAPAAEAAALQFIVTL